MFSKINVANIIRDHISTLRDYQTKRLARSDIFLFFGIPLLVAGLALCFCGIMTGTITTLLTTSLSIFAALLFNLLLLLYEAIRKEEKPGNTNKLRKPFLKEIFNNISFSILISVLAIILLLVYSQIETAVVRSIITFLCYNFVTTFILTLMMILKRTHILMSKEIEEKPN